MKYNYIFIIFIFFAQCLHAQTTFEQIYNAPNHDFQGLDVKQTSDEGFLILSVIGNTTAFLYTKANVTKLDETGEIEWSKNYDFDTHFQKSGDLILLEKDSFIFLVGEANDSINKIISKATPNGTVIWSENLGNIEFESNLERIVSLTVNEEKSTLGIFEMQGERPRAEIFGAKMDLAGNLKWAKTYLPEEFGTFELYNRIKGQSTKDDGYILVGNVTDITIYSDAFLMRIDSTGEVVWAKSYGNTAPYFREAGLAVVQTPDLGYFVAGQNISGNNSTLKHDGFLMKTDSLGEVLWVNFVDVDSSAATACLLFDILLTNRGTVLVSGISLNAQQGLQSLLLEFSQEGYLLNQHKYPEKIEFSNVGGLDITTDGGAVILNSTKDSLGKRELYLIKTDETGDSGCSDTFIAHITRLDSIPTIPQIVSSMDLDSIHSKTPIVTDFNDLNPPTATPPPTIEIQIELNEMCTNDTAIISFTGTDFFKYQWSNGVVNQNTIVVTEEGNYAVSVTGCGEAFAEIEIDCEYPFDECIAIPNAFTPNGDNINDQFAPVVYEECERGIEIKEIIIWSRWGKKIFTGNSPDVFWNGDFQDNGMPADVYYYWIRAENSALEEMIFKGDVTLIR